MGGFSSSLRASIDAQVDARWGLDVRTTVTLDDGLPAQAQQLCGDLERSALLREALQALVQRESARWLAALGGSEPTLRPNPRRRSGLRCRPTPGCSPC